MSSVIVKGMEMPDSCYHCKIAESCGHYIANYTDRRHPDCPLGALPDKHGELIDRNGLLRDIEHYHLSDGKFQHWVEIQNAIVEEEGNV